MGGAWRGRKDPKCDKRRLACPPCGGGRRGAGRGGAGWRAAAPRRALHLHCCPKVAHQNCDCGVARGRKAPLGRESWGRAPLWDTLIGGSAPPCPACPNLSSPEPRRLGKMEECSVGSGGGHGGGRGACRSRHARPTPTRPHLHLPDTPPPPRRTPSPPLTAHTFIFPVLHFVRGCRTDVLHVRCSGPVAGRRPITGRHPLLSPHDLATATSAPPHPPLLPRNGRGASQPVRGTPTTPAVRAGSRNAEIPAKCRRAPPRRQAAVSGGAAGRRG
ncbi:hypothetical protein E2C01_090732 [Portunus trituberculatus]|uniref:Uncharacterized protein n=1 Tax=Portunus trituberculatus TaxID=210409 RepID=A0A5B7JLN4_PORTR|nr:hypothetical protein [Portunus trituberculatus]